MKANELMIGDWVVYDGDVEYTNPIKVEGIDIATGALVTSDREDVGIDNIQPIPLTSDILNKNFPDTRDDVFWCWDDRKSQEEIWYEVRIEKNYETVFMLDIRYVHELQHALRLCGIEKEIEL